MEAQRCDCYGCQNGLITFDEVMAGVCEPHMKYMESDEAYIGVCWNCCKVTVVGTRLDPKGRLMIKDKYIFSKGCRHCTGKEESNIDWMTINSESSPTSYVEVRVKDSNGKALLCKISPITENINA